MAIYIKGMEMPKGCRDCRFEDWGRCIAIRPIRTIRHLSEEREVYCPLIEVPEPHGRLIDADALEYKLGVSDEDIYVRATLDEDAPTVIERSE